MYLQFSCGAVAGFAHPGFLDHVSRREPKDAHTQLHHEHRVGRGLPDHLVYFHN
jgi:hypothetical protein